MELTLFGAQQILAENKKQMFEELRDQTILQSNELKDVEIWLTGGAVVGGADYDVITAHIRMNLNDHIVKDSRKLKIQTGKTTKEALAEFLRDFIVLNLMAQILASEQFTELLKSI